MNCRTAISRSTRGVAYWPGGKGTGARIVFGTRTGKLIALDAATGKPAADFGTAGLVDMKTPEVMNGMRSPLGMSSPPAIYQDLIITGSRVQEMPVKGAAGDVRAWDARTGKLVWTFHTIPQPGEPGFGTWAGDSWKGRSGTNVWTSPIVDEKRGIAYLPIGAPTFDRWGGDREGNNLFRIRSSRWTRRPANISGTSRPSIMTSGIWTCRRLR